MNFCKEKGQKGAVKQGTARLLQRQKLQAPQTTDTMQGHPTQEGHILPQTLLLNEKIKQKMNSPPPVFSNKKYEKECKCHYFAHEKESSEGERNLKAMAGSTDVSERNLGKIGGEKKQCLQRKRKNN